MDPTYEIAELDTRRPSLRAPMPHEVAMVSGPSRGLFLRDEEGHWIPADLVLRAMAALRPVVGNDDERPSGPPEGPGASDSAGPSLSPTLPARAA